ncbi:DUF4339 domain-containing protein [bacterium]|nr:DUF4339 domain-containing protein [bacterium]
MTPPRSWYLYTDQGADGPYTVEELRNWRQEGRITSDWYVRRDGQDEWRKLGDTTELSGDDAPNPPIINPPASTLTLRLENPEPRSDTRRPVSEKSFFPEPRKNRPTRTADTADRSFLIKFFVFFAFILLILGLIYPQMDDWEKIISFTSESGKYSVRYPGSHSHRTDKVEIVPTEIGKIQMPYHVAEPGGQLFGIPGVYLMLAKFDVVSPIEVFIAFHFRIPKDIAARKLRKDDKVLLEGAIEGGLENIKGTALETTWIQYDQTHTGVEIRYKGNYRGVDLHGRFRAYVVKDMVYVLMFGGRMTAAAGHESGKKFLDSFVLK